MLHIKKITSIFLLLFLFIYSFCKPAIATIIASIKPIGFIASAIADGVMPVEVLLPDGASEHNYSLRPSDIKRLKKGDIVVWIGPDIETFISKTVNILDAKKNLKLASLSTVKPLLLSRSLEGDRYQGEDKNYLDTKNIGIEYKNCHEKYDMHLWMSPKIAHQSAVAFYEKLLELMPHRKDTLNANLRKFELELIKIDEKIAHQLEPFKEKGYFVFHDAYTYFERHYGLTPLGYFSVSPDIQPGAQRLHQIRSQLVEKKAICIFSEPQFKSAIIDVVTRGTQARKGTLDPLGISIRLGKDSYIKFLLQLSNQYVNCLKEL